MTSEKVTTVEDKQLRDYELVLIIRPEVEAEKLDSIIDNVSRFITGRGGSVAEVERWGMRKLAYPIDHFVEGNYVLTRLKLQPRTSNELEANLDISEDILRYLLVKLSSRVRGV